MRVISTLLYPVLFLSVTVYADFHIWSRIQRSLCLAENCEDIVVDDLVACPWSNQGCGCWGTGSSAARIENWDELELPPSGVFRVPTGFCGQTKPLDFYRVADGSWVFYTEGGEGGIKGTCVNDSDKDVETCPTGFLTTATAKKELWCQTPICA